MGRFRSVSVIFLTLALNIFLTGGIYVLWGALIKFTQELLRVGFAGWVSDLYFFFNMLWSDFTNHLFDYPGHPQQKFRGLGHFAFYTTFFTSVWIWMYALATFVVVLGDRYGGSIWSWLKHFLDFSNRPFSSLGYVACLAVILVSIFAGFIYFSTLWVINLV